MSVLARIRKTALQHEQERQYDKALALYARLLDGAEAGEEEVDVALFNRAGDLALRVGDTPRALGYFERALDQYASGGMLNNAIALGVKILRHAPAHLSAHYTLGVLYGRKGFASEARHHLLTYAAQMQRAGRADESTRVLGEVAAACLDVGERRAALDAYGALGGDLAHAAALAAEPAPVAPAPASAPTVDEAPIMWGAVDFEAETEVAAPEPHAVADENAAPLTLLGWDETPVETRVDTPVSNVGGDWEALDLEPIAPTEWDVGTEDAGAPSLVFLDVDARDDTAAHGDSLVPLDLDLSHGEVPAPELPLIDVRHVDVLPIDPTPVDVAPVDVAPMDETSLGSGHDGVIAAPRWADALPGEPPPLRLAELLRLDVESEPQELRSLATALPAEDALAAERWLPEHMSHATYEPYSEPPRADVGQSAPVPTFPFALDAPDPALAEALDVALDLPMIVRVESEPTVAAPTPAAPTPTTWMAAGDDLLDLGAWLRDTEDAPSTRLTTASVPQTGDEQADFDATLKVFTAGVARAVEHEDFDSHYDLGVAFREMGLVEEAIVEFQRAALAPGRPLRALEALAQCFLDARQPDVALSTLEGPVAAAAAAGTGDASLVAVHYLMGAAAQALGRSDDARRWFVRVVATDVRFRDAAARLAALPPPSSSR